MSETLKNNETYTEQATGWENMDAYRKVDTREYVEAGLADGSLEVFEAAKHARIGAIKGEVGQEVISWSEDENGNPIQEKVATVTADKETGETGWIATKTDAEGNPIVDKNGHTNQWIIDDATFKKKYEVDAEHPGIFKPAGGVQKFVETRENLTISQWGEEMKMPRGSFINITNPDDMYAINPRDFDDTYTRTEAAEDAPDITTDHRGREYINLDKIDMTEESGQMQFAEGYVNNNLNRVMTEIEDQEGEGQDWEKLRSRGEYSNLNTLAAEYAIAKWQQQHLDGIRTKFLTAAAMGEEEPYKDVMEAISETIDDLKPYVLRDYLPEICVEAPERLLKALKEQLSKNPK